MGVAPSEQTHPYGVSVDLVLGNNVDLELGDADASLTFGPDHVLTIRQTHTSPTEQANNLQHVSLQLEGFRTASEAEAAGRFLAIAVLWSAVSKRFTLVFEKWSGSLPFVVYERAVQGSRFAVRGEGRSFWHLSPLDLSRLMLAAYSRSPAYDASLVISMELYASARLEMSERSRFITLMTALEAISVQTIYDTKVAEALKEAAHCLEMSPHLTGSGQAVVDSLSGRIRGLQQESVRQAIVRTVNHHLPHRDDIAFVDEAYGIRSKMLHEGLKVADLHQVTYRLESMLRRIYADIIGVTLEVPA
jgi:hypothetical protein